jgi:hypothetical protein
MSDLQVVPTWTGRQQPAYFFSFKQPLEWDKGLSRQYTGG